MNTQSTFVSMGVLEELEPSFEDGDRSEVFWFSNLTTTVTGDRSGVVCKECQEPPSSVLSTKEDHVFLISLISFAT